MYNPFTRIRVLWSKGLIYRLLLIITGLLFSCCLLVVLVSLAPTPELRDQAADLVAGDAPTSLAEVAQPVAGAPIKTPRPAEPTRTPVPTRTPRPTASPTAIPIGRSRQYPLPYGETIQADDGIELTIRQVERGSAAAAKIKGYNMFNGVPGEGQEFVLVVVQTKYTGPADKTATAPRSYFRLVGEQGAIHGDITVVLGKNFREMFGGGSCEGEIAFMIPQGEHELVLIYAGAGMKARYLSLGQ